MNEGIKMMHFPVSGLKNVYKFDIFFLK